MSRPTRILLVGAGRMALNHMRAIQKMPELGVIVGGVDPWEGARQQSDGSDIRRTGVWAYRRNRYRFVKPIVEGNSVLAVGNGGHQIRLN